jgi:hypothetical protein
LAVFVLALKARNKKRFIWVLLLMIQFIWFFLWGRRDIGFFAYLVVAGVFFDKSINLQLRSWLRVKTVATISLLTIVLVAGVNFYQQLRVVGGVGILQNLNMSTIGRTIEVLRASDKEMIQEATKFNVEVRTISTVAAVSQYTALIDEKRARLGNGQEIYNSLLRATPSDFFVDKSSLVVAEALASQLTDGAINKERDLGGTLIFEGLMDFGRFGVVLYPLLLAGILSIFFCLMMVIRIKIAIVVSVIVLVYTTLSLAEGGIAEFFLGIRASLLILVVTAAGIIMQECFRGRSGLKNASLTLSHH